MIKKYIKKYWKTLCAIIILTTAQALLTLMLPDYLSNIISNGIGLGNMNYIWITGTKMLLVTALTIFLAIMINYICSKFSADFSKKLREEVFTKLAYMEEQEYKTFSTSSLITRTTNDITQIQTVFTTFFRMISYALVIGIGGTIKAISKSNGMTFLAIIVCIGIALVLAMLIFMFCYVVPKYDVLQNLLDGLNAKTRESLNGILVIRAFGKEKKEENDFEKMNQEYSDLDLFLNRMMVLLNPYVSIVLNGVLIAIVWMMAYRATSIEMIGNMMAFSQYATQILSAFITLSVIFVYLPKAMVSYKRIHEVLEKQSNITSGTKQLSDFVGPLTLDHVTYYYPNSENPALEDITLTIPPNKTTAIIGSTGSGKTTLIHLMSHLLDTKEGIILFNHEDIHTYRLKDIRKNITVIPQHTFLFQGTIESNIKDGYKNARKKDIEEAMNDACIDFVKDLKDEVSLNGKNYSGGQRQRITIARALVRKPKFLIIDDALSALDFKTDAKIRENIKKKDMTLVLVSSRIGTIKNADQIIVLDEGKIVGIGSHQKLMKACKVYQEIAVSQLGGDAK